MRGCQSILTIPYRAALVLAGLLCTLGSGADFAGGTGEPNDPYQIATAEQLISIGIDPSLLDKHFVLLNDIDLDPNLPGGRVFDHAVIGEEGRIDTEFSGGFSGGGHIIRNLVIVSKQDTPVGLFATLTGRAAVEGLGLENASVSGVETVGALVGENGGTITACYATGVVMCHTRAKYRPKGSAEEAKPPIDEGYAQMMAQLREIYGDRYVTQVGQQDQPEIPARAGGLVAVNHRRIESCYAAVTVETTSENPDMIDLGGLMGANSGQISASYSVGSVARETGGLIGNNTYTSTGPTPLTGHVFLSFWDIQASGNATSAAGVGRTTAQMMDVEMYQGWDYEGHWTIDSGSDYPRLRWEARAGAPMPGFGAYVEGTGESNDPFVIETADELTKVGRFRSIWDRHLALGNDIDMSVIDPNDFAPIGTFYWPFTGVFDGRGHTIHKFTHRHDADGRAGLFGLVGHRRLGQVRLQGLIENVNIRKGSVSGRNRVGLLAGENWGTIRGCHVEGTVAGTRRDAGGLVGFSTGTIQDCSAAGAVRGGTNVGGLVGQNWGEGEGIDNCRSSCTVAGRNSVGGLAGQAGGDVRRSYATGRVEGTTHVGGLIGDANARVWACYATGGVSGDRSVGGLVGCSFGSIVACYASGTVTGKDSVGGLVGYNMDGIVACYSTGKVSAEKALGGLIGTQSFMGKTKSQVGSDFLCFWDRQTSGTATSDGGIGKTPAQLMQGETFKGWGLGDVWVLNENHDYPRLAWQGSPGTPIRDNPQRYGGGTGTANDPFQIQTINHLCTIGTHPGDFGSHFVLTQDLDLADLDPNAFVPIGVEGYPFTGRFDGQGHTIARLAITRPNEDYVALFGNAGPSPFNTETPPALITDLHLRDIRIQGQKQVGGLAGRLGKGTIRNCTVTGEITGEGYVGGLVGISYARVAHCTVHADVHVDHHGGVLMGDNIGIVEYCGATGRITGDNRLGGLIGLNADDDSLPNAYPSDRGGRISQCRADCVVTGGKEIGGLVGYTASDARIESCYAKGTVAGQEEVGGLVGSFQKTSITNSYAATAVSGKEKVGGFIGRNSDYEDRRIPRFVSGTISSCFWDTGLSALTSGAGNDPDPIGLAGLPTGQMQKATAFIDAGWDFEGVWTIREGDNYPHLQWEIE